MKRDNFMDHDERSDKIVNLARAMIQHNAPQAAPRYSLKTIAFAAMLSATLAGGAAVLAVEQYRPLNRYEKIEIRALIHYAAKLNTLDGQIIEDDLYRQFGVQSLDDLSMRDMHDVRRFLQKYIH